MSTEENKSVIRRLYAGVLKDNLAIAPEVLADDYTYRAPGLPLIRGVGGYLQLMGRWVSAFPDLTLAVDNLIAEGDDVVLRWEAHGTHQGEFLGVPATGKEVAISGVLISRFAAGRIVDDWEIADLLGLLRQVGAIPTPK
jgi:steroid delta-isomerase-like uncharacterized protein